MDPYCRHIDFKIQTKAKHIQKTRFEDSQSNAPTSRLPRANWLIGLIIVRVVGLFLHPAPKLSGVIRVRERDHRASRDPQSRLAWTRKAYLSSRGGTFHSRALQINCGHCPLSWWWVFLIYFRLTSEIITVLSSNKYNESGVGECAGYPIPDCGVRFMSIFCYASTPRPSATSRCYAMEAMLLRCNFDGGRRRNGASPLSSSPIARASSSTAHSETLSPHC